MKKTNNKPRFTDTELGFIYAVVHSRFDTDRRLAGRRRLTSKERRAYALAKTVRGKLVKMLPHGAADSIDSLVSLLY